jgi:RNA polymerase sigma-32 factor
MERATERGLIERWQRHRDLGARNELVRQHMRTVEQVAWQFRRYPLPHEDLVAEGYLGLMRAIDRFELDRETRLVTYAGYWIRAYMTAAIAKAAARGRTCTLVGRTRFLWAVPRLMGRARALVDDPDRVERLVARSLHLSIESLRRGLAGLEADMSLDARMVDGGWYDRMPDGGPGPDELFLDAEDHRLSEAMAARALDALDRRERYIVEGRFMEPERRTLADLGRDLGISRERARQLEQRALGKMRAALGAGA